jgi:hypothetical protein
MADQVRTKKRPKSVTALPTVVYVYAITPAGKKTIAAPRFGIDGVAGVVPIAVGEVICWVSHVDGLEFGEQLSERMENLEWLANAGVRHQQVVAALAEQSAVVPARFGTVFSGDEALIADVKRRKRGIATSLKHVSDSDEWGIKVFGEAPKPLMDVNEGASSGRDYLKRKAVVLERRGERKPDAELTRFVSALKKTATDMAAVGKVSSGQRNLLWQGAFLVKRKSHGKFNRVLRQFASKWQGEKTIECTGPWPPYSFVSRNGR